jgi:predicted TIM-barrel fold metal-dependent hydrolase
MSFYSGPLIDVDVHHNPTSDFEHLEYVPQRSRDLAASYVRHGVPLASTRMALGLIDDGQVTIGRVPNGGPPGSSYKVLESSLLDPYSVFRCLLTFNIGQFAAHLNPYLSADLCRAANDWNVDRWLSIDDERLYSGIIVAGQLPSEAAHEIRRLASHRKMTFVQLVGYPLGRPLGDPIFHEIYAAAVEAELPMLTHVQPTESPNLCMSIGPHARFLEHLANNIGASAHHHITSLIVHGVFEKFRTLRFAFNEFGCSWIPSLLWNLERRYDLFRLESPWVKRRPSEYMMEHMTFTTQPLEFGRNPDDLVELLDAIEGIENILCFSSDFPHWTMDDFFYVSTHLPTTWHSKVFCENACRLLGWSPPTTEVSRVRILKAS